MQLPVSMHIRPMRNGMPSDVEIIPGSTVYVAHNAVQTSTDGSVATNFTFEEPVYLQGFTAVSYTHLTLPTNREV